MKQTTRRRKLTFAFCLRCCLTWLLALAMITQSAAIPAARAANPKTPPPSSSPKEPPATPPAPQSNVDLTVTALNTSAVVTDSQTLVTSGDLGVTIKNLGADGVNAQFRVIAFEDRNGNGAFNQGVDLLLGSKQFIDGVPANASASLSIGLSGTVTFKGNLIYVWVDSENAVAETNEGNNIRYSNQSDSGVSIPTLFNTGVDNSRNVLPLGSVDPHYSLTSSADPNFPGPNAVTVADSFWLSNSPASNWISVNPGRSSSVGNYSYTTTFDLTGFDPTKAVIRGRWITDNNGLDIKINGTSTGFTTPYGAHFTWHDFTIFSGFVAGLNTLEFSYFEGGFIHGLRVEVSGTVGASTDPDLTASFLRKNDASFPTSTELTARIGNGGGTPVPPAVKVSFYRGDPASGGTLIGTTQTTISLSPGQYEDVKVVWNNPPIGLHPITVVADDNGSGQGTVVEGNENNNKANANIALGIGPFTLVDDLIARFKDGVVDLKWSPINGATSYNIYRRSGNQSAQIIKRGHTLANYPDAGLTNGTTYYYTVRWVDANGRESGDGTEMSATPTSQTGRDNVPPTILSAPVTRAVANQPYSYQARA
ncbi:MAG: CARDB domain-containing protein [Blastocatellia bacterium]